MNSLVLPARGEIWQYVGLELTKNGFPPAIWFGPHKLSRFAAETFPGCDVIDYKKIHAEIPTREAKYFAPAEYLRSRDFMHMKLQVLKLMDRQDDTRAFGKLEREAIFYGMFNYLYSLIVEKRITVLVSCEAPHGPGYLIAYRICEYLGIPTYHLVRNSLVPLMQINTSIVGPPIPVLDAPDTTQQIKLLRDSLAEYENRIPTPYYMADQAAFDRDFNFPKAVLKHWLRWLIRRTKIVLGRQQRPSDDIVRHARFTHERNEVSFNHPFVVRRLRRALRDEYERLSRGIDWESPDLPKFVYFPMPYEPERTSNPDGGDFYEAMDALIALREFVPAEVAIFVKEHPSQYSAKLKGFQGRSPLHYQAIAQLSNVQLVDIGVPSSTLVERSEFVACITGTAALEAALIGRRSVVFGSPWFYQLPGVHHFDTLTDFTALMNAPTFTVKQIGDAAQTLIEATAIPAATSGSQENYFRAKFGENWAANDWAQDAAESLVKTIIDDFPRRANR
jgi:hypothetical protein